MCAYSHECVCLCAHECECVVEKGVCKEETGSCSCLLSVWNISLISVVVSKEVANIFSFYVISTVRTFELLLDVDCKHCVIVVGEKTDTCIMGQCLYHDRKKVFIKSHDMI